MDLARFERATSTFAESHSDSAELQVQRFGIAECGLRIYETPISILQSAISNHLAEATGLEPAHAVRGDLANRCHTIRRRLRRFRISDVGLRIGLCQLLD